jgi:hypothetical protein
MCTPPCTFCSPNHSSGRGTDIELKLYLGGSSAGWDALTELTVYFSAGSVQYAVQPYYSIEILPFRGFVSSSSFLRVIYRPISWSR